MKRAGSGSVRGRVERDFDERPRVGFLQHHRGEFGVQRVAAAVRDEVTNQRMADERHVADHIQNLVPHELVVEPERVVQHAGVADDDRVLERAAERETVLAQPLDFLQEAEGARRRDFVDERVLAQANGPRLVAQQRMVEAML